MSCSGRITGLCYAAVDLRVYSGMHGSMDTRLTLDTRKAGHYQLLLPLWLWFSVSLFYSILSPLLPSSLILISPFLSSFITFFFLIYVLHSVLIPPLPSFSHIRSHFFSIHLQSRISYSLLLPFFRLFTFTLFHSL